MSAKHTPGPWVQLPEVDEDGATGRLELIVYGPEYAQEYAGEQIQVRDTVCVLGYSHHQAHQANAALICAAPQLLRTMAVIADALDTLDGLDNIKRLTRAAIAAATGQKGE